MRKCEPDTRLLQFGCGVLAWRICHTLSIRSIFDTKTSNRIGCFCRICKTRTIAPITGSWNGIKSLSLFIICRDINGDNGRRHFFHHFSSRGARRRSIDVPRQQLRHFPNCQLNYACGERNKDIYLISVIILHFIENIFLRSTRTEKLLQPLNTKKQALLLHK